MAPYLVLGLNLAVTAGIGAARHPDLLFVLATENAPLAWQQGMLLAACASEHSDARTEILHQYRKEER
jgi:hypothetical protein